jgi:DNA-binding NtrC family response regulator
MPLRVLVLDDDVDLLAVLQEAIEGDEFTVQTSKTVKNATLLLESTEFDVVVTDLALDGTGGLAFCQKLAQSRPALPIVVMSGHKEARSAALRMGAREMLVKPFDADALLRILRRLTAKGG